MEQPPSMRYESFPASGTRPPAPNRPRPMPNPISTLLLPATASSMSSYRSSSLTSSSPAAQILLLGDDVAIRLVGNQLKLPRQQRAERDSLQRGFHDAAHGRGEREGFGAAMGSPERAQRQLPARLLLRIRKRNLLRGTRGPPVNPVEVQGPRSSPRPCTMTQITITSLYSPKTVASRRRFRRGWHRSPRLPQ